MGRMREAKKQLLALLQQESWRNHLDLIAQGGVTSVGPLFSFLLQEPTLLHRAAVALGQTCAAIAQHECEKARNVVRRYMWHLSEESGNIGWGIPEAFAETMVASPLLAKEFSRILITYVIDLGKTDNYCDNDVLRRSCYWACGRFAEGNVECCLGWRKWLVRGLEDRDIPCRGMAAWALSRMPIDFDVLPKLKDLVEQNLEEVCLLFDGHKAYQRTVRAIAEDALRGRH
ncbi:MAG: HEAT repeat domain-containing protein [Desulfovibrio sp.]|nr:HEAT repeat domain-containing protein [Desulfovibrio sp.]